VLLEWRAALDQQVPVVTDVWWLPAVLAPLWIEKQVYVLPRASSTARMAALESWGAVAAGQGVTSFTYATTGPLEPLLSHVPPGLRHTGSSSRLDLNTA